MKGPPRREKEGRANPDKTLALVERDQRKIIEGLQGEPRELEEPRKRRGRVQQFPPDSQALGRLGCYVAGKEHNFQALQMDGGSRGADDLALTLRG